MSSHILYALCGEGSDVARDLLYAITLVVNLWMRGRCPVSLVEFAASTPLTSLLKLNGGIQPIVVGYIGRRLISKVVMKIVSKDVGRHLNDFQFGVRVSGGAKVILHGANKVLSKRNIDGSLPILMVDFSNSFNMVD